MTRTLSTLTMLLLASLLLASCAPKRQAHGYMPRSSKVDELTLGVSTKAQIVENIGSPAFINSFADNRWHYVAFRTEQTGFQTPEITEYRVLQLVFNEQHVLEELNMYDKDNLIAINFDLAKTPASGRKMTFMEQFLGNIGRFN